MMEFIHWAKATATLGGLGALATPAILLLLWWRALPSLISAIERLILAFTDRSTKLAAGFDAQIKRLEEQLKAADARYEARDKECQARVEQLQDEVDELRQLLSGMRANEQQRQKSAVSLAERNGMPAIVGPLIAALDKVPGTDGEV